MTGPVELEDLFAAGRAEAAPSAAFMARIEAEALALQPQRRGDAAPPRAFAVVLQAIGGWRGAGGLAMAMLVGFWIGVSDGGGLPGSGDADVVFDDGPGLGNPFVLSSEEG